MISLVLDCVDRLNVYNTAAHFSEFAGEEAGDSWREIVNLFYELLGMSTFSLNIFKKLTVFYMSMCFKIDVPFLFNIFIFL